MKPSNESRIDEFLAGYVMGELTAEELQELEDSLQSIGAQSLSELERISSTVSLAAIAQTEALPDHLRQAISANGRELIAVANLDRNIDFRPSQVNRARRLRETLAWIACLAASILAFVFWQNRSLAPNQMERTVLTRDALIAKAPDLIRASWRKGTTPLKNEVTGDVIWSDSAQSGFMRFVGLPVNDPNVSQYQLWIYDPTRDSEPVDGGVFDISSPAESVIAIRAKLPVDQPVAFAVTIEKPGGVVVSELENLPLLAYVRANDRQTNPNSPEI